MRLQLKESDGVVTKMALQFAVVLALSSPCWSQELSSEVESQARQMIVRVVSDEDKDRPRAGSGFLWPDAGHVVTSLHVVAGDDQVTVEYPFRDGRIEPRSARVERVFLNADLALLSVDDPLDRQPGTITDAVAGSVWVLGYPIGLPESWGRHLDVSQIAPTTLRAAIEDVDEALFEQLGFPALDLEAVMLEGRIVPGDSGAAIINSVGQIVAIGSGGLRGGTMGLGWAMPSEHLDELITSDDAVPVGTEVFLKLVRSLFTSTTYSSGQPPRGSQPFRTSFEVEGAPGPAFVPTDPIFAACLPLSSSFTNWSRVSDAHSGRYAISLNPEGNPSTGLTQTNYCRSPSLAISAAILDTVFETSGSVGLDVSYFRKTTSNPRPSDIHNCDSSMTIYVSRDSGAWEPFSAQCGQFRSESDGWQEMRITIPADGAETIQLGFTYELQNSEVADSSAMYLIDDFEVHVR